MKNTCASCEGLSVTKVIKVNNEKKPKWLQKIDYVSQFIEKNNNKKISIKTPSKYDTKMELDLGKSKAGKYVLYWAAEKSDTILIKDAKKAYGNFKNNGIAKIDKHGKVKLCFNCPQSYNTTEKNKKTGETFYKHIHFCYSNASNDKWLDTVYTKIVLCKLTLKQVLKKHRMGHIVLINALPCEYYQKAHISNSFNLPYNKISKYSQKELFSWFKEVIDVNYPLLSRFVKEKKLNIYELPIVVYCAHDKCDAGYKAAIQLMKKGFVNLSKFPGGMKEYLK